MEGSEVWPDLRAPQGHTRDGFGVATAADGKERRLAKSRGVTWVAVGLRWGVPF